MLHFIRILTVVFAIIPVQVFAFRISDLQSCDGVAVKTLVKSDTLSKANKSKASEIRNIRNLEKIFGPDKLKFDSKFYLWGDDVKMEDGGRTTWYFLKPKTPKGKKQYRLYYTKNNVMKAANAGDLLVVCKQDDKNVLLFVAQKDSEAEKEVHKTLGLSGSSAKTEKNTESKSWFARLFKSDNTPKTDAEVAEIEPPVVPNNAWIRIYFTPGTDCENNIIEQIYKTQKKIDVAVYSITNQKIVDSLLAADKRGVKVRVISDRSQSRGQHSLTKNIQDAGIPFVVNKKHKIMHNKFAIFDDKDVETGSYNWTASATKSNAENCLFFPEQDKKFIEQFGYLWGLYTEGQEL